MKKQDLLKLIGETNGAEYAPIAGMLHSGYGFVGFFNSTLNEGMEETFVLLNARLVDLRQAGDERSHSPRIADFNEFIEEIVQQRYPSGDEPQLPHKDVYGKSIPLAAVPLDEITVIYPVGHITKMLKSLQKKESSKLPDFLDFDQKSIVLKVLRARLW